MIRNLEVGLYHYLGKPRPSIRWEENPCPQFSNDWTRHWVVLERFFFSTADDVPSKLWVMMLDEIGRPIGVEFPADRKLIRMYASVMNNRPKGDLRTFVEDKPWGDGRTRNYDERAQRGFRNRAQGWPYPYPSWNAVPF